VVGTVVVADVGIVIVGDTVGSDVGEEDWD
jgi:hypothetical protein